MLVSQIKWQRHAVMVHLLIYLLSVILYQQRLSGSLKTNLNMWYGIGSFEECYKEFDYFKELLKKLFLYLVSNQTATYQRLQKDKVSEEKIFIRNCKEKIVLPFCNISLYGCEVVWVSMTNCYDEV